MPIDLKRATAECQDEFALKTSLNTSSDDDMPPLDDSPVQTNNAPSFLKTIQQPSASMLARSMSAVINPLGAAAQLTDRELEQLPYEEFLELSKEQQETLIRLIRIDRSEDPDDSRNSFLDYLNKLLKLGVSLKQFAQLTYRQQRIFVNDEFIYLSLKNGISFEKLATLDYFRIRGIMEYFSSNNRLLPLYDVYREILGKESNDPEIIKSRSRVVEAINKMLDEEIARSNQVSPFHA